MSSQILGCGKTMNVKSIHRWKKDLQALVRAKDRYGAVSRAIRKSWPEWMNHVAVSVSDVKTDRGNICVQIRVGKKKVGRLELRGGEAWVSLRDQEPRRLLESLQQIREVAESRARDSEDLDELEVQARLLGVMMLPAAKRPALRLFAPVTLAGIPYQMPSETAPRGLGLRRGNLDILARRGKGSSAWLAVLELKKREGSGVESCLEQAATYARAVRDLVSSKDLSELAREAFGTTRNVNYRVRVDAIAVVHADDVKKVRQVEPERDMGVSILSYRLDNSDFGELRMLKVKEPPRHSGS